MYETDGEHRRCHACNSTFPRAWLDTHQNGAVALGGVTFCSSGKSDTCLEKYVSRSEHGFIRAQFIARLKHLNPSMVFNL